MDQLKFEANGLSMTYGNNILFQELNWEANAGDFCAVEGNNGVGKSTLLKILAGIVQPIAGSVTLNGKSIDSISIDKRKDYIGYMPSKRTISGWIDVETAVGVGANKVQAELLEDLLVEFQLNSKRNQLIQTLSDGEYVRMQLIRLVIQDPKVILLDEPAAMLDSSWRKKIYEFLAQWSTRGKVVVICSHELELNKLYCNQILHL